MNCATKGCPPLREGSRVCHCAACHETFGTLTLFDAHHDVDYNRDPAVLCREPGVLGMVQAENLIWWTPEALSALTERVGKMAEARRAAA